MTVTSFMTEIRAYEVYEAFSDADYDVTLTLRRYAADTRDRNGVSDTGSFEIVVQSIRFHSTSESFKRLEYICKTLGVEWEITNSARSVNIVPRREEWLPAYTERRERYKRTRGFCAQCERDVTKQASSALCEECIAENVYRARFGDDAP
jgi:hypothetical protein